MEIRVEKKSKKVNYTIRRIMLVTIVLLVFWGISALMELLVNYIHPLAIGFMFTLTMLVIRYKKHTVTKQ